MLNTSDRHLDGRSFDSGPSALQVPGDGHRSGIETLAREAGAQRDDPLAHRFRCPAGAAAWPARARLDGLEAALAVAADA
jgi:hypothetical protein